MAYKNFLDGTTDRHPNSKKIKSGSSSFDVYGETAPEKKKKKSFLGMWVWVDKGYEVIGQNLKGKLKKKKSGLRFFPPWYPKRELVYTTHSVMDIPVLQHFTKDAYDVQINPSVTYNIEDSELFYENRESALKKLNDVIESLIRKEAEKHNFETLKGIHLTPQTQEKIINDNGEEEIKITYNYDDLQSLRDKFGINVESINITSVSVTGKIKEALEENKIADEKRKRDLQDEKNKTALVGEQAKQERINADVKAYEFKQFLHVMGDDAAAHEDFRAMKMAEGGNATFVMGGSSNNMEDLTNAIIATNENVNNFVKAMTINKSMYGKKKTKINKQESLKKVSVKIKKESNQSNKEAGVVNIQFPFSEKNPYWDGKVHVVVPGMLASINKSDYYYMEGYDHSHDMRIMALLRKIEDKFFKVPLDDYYEFGNLLHSFDLDYVSTSSLNENIGLLPQMTVEELKSQLGINNKAEKKAKEVKKVKIQFPLSSTNSYWDGKIHDVTPGMLASINDTNYYYMEGQDHSYNMRMMTLLQENGGIFSKIPLDNYDEFNKLMGIVDLNYVSTSLLNENIGLLPQMTVEELKSQLGLGKGTK